MAPIDGGFRRRLQRALTLWIDGLEVHIRRGQDAGFVKRELDAREVAHFVVLMHEGVYGMLKGLGDPLAFQTLFAPVKSSHSIEAPRSASHAIIRHPRRQTDDLQGIPTMTHRTLLLATMATLSAATVAAQQAPDLAAYLMPDRAAEIAMARSAAPKYIADSATILVLTRSGYVEAVRGTNGFLCYVQRSFFRPDRGSGFWDPANRGPLCLNPPGSAHGPDRIAKARRVDHGRCDSG